MRHMIYPATLICDFYKISHRKQYPQGTEKVYSTWTPRESRIGGVDRIVAFGFQSFIKEYLITYFEENFFSRSKEEVIAEYTRIVKYTLGDTNPDSSHIAALHDIGYLPLRIKALPEGTLVPIRVPMLTIENTIAEFFWVTNYIETLMSLSLWKPSTSATLALEYKKILDGYANRTSDSLDAVKFQAHDFSMRGMDRVEAAAISGAGHLLSFVGTDTIPAICFLEKYYHADIEKELVGCSVPASEHSTMCVNGQDELTSYTRFITEIYPSGIVSIVSDTWDLWSVLNDVIRPLKDLITKRDGKVVIRPDSGDPADIICGDPSVDNINESKGVIQILWDIFGGTINSKGFKELDPHIGAIYGDAITLERCKDICERLMKNGFSSTNIIFGVGSYTYGMNSRDTFGFALKSTYAVVNGEERQIFKDPITDKAKVKKSQTGMVKVVKVNGAIEYIDKLNAAQRNSADNDLLQDVFLDGKILVDDTLSNIRARLLKNT
jgi:nicotinamide phosphoribosyltransferase